MDDKPENRDEAGTGTSGDGDKEIDDPLTHSDEDAPHTEFQARTPE